MPKVTNHSTGKTVDCEQGASLREVAQANDLGIPFGCESGICCTCLIQITSGGEKINEKTEIESMTLEARGAPPEQRLACQCRVNDDLEFDQAY